MEIEPGDQVSWMTSGHFPYRAKGTVVEIVDDTRAAVRIKRSESAKSFPRSGTTKIKLEKLRKEDG